MPQSATSRFLSGYFDDREMNGISDLGDLLMKKKKGGAAATDPDPDLSEIEALTAKLLPEELLRIRNVTDAEAIAHLVAKGWKGKVLAYLKFGASPRGFTDAFGKVLKIVGLENLRVVLEVPETPVDPAIFDDFETPPPPIDPYYTGSGPFSLAAADYAYPYSSVYPYPFVPLNASDQYTPYSAVETTGAKPAKRPKVETSADGPPASEDLRTLIQEVKSLRDLVQQQRPTAEEDLRKLVREVIREESGRDASTSVV